MNERDRIDRMLTAWTDESWSPPPPAYLDVVLERTRHTRQRRAWASLERWLPMELTLRRPILAMPARLLAILLALVLLLIAAMSLPLLLGTRLPATVVGEWRNGLIAYARAGDIWVVDPEVDEPQVLIGGPTADEGPGWSPDGTRIAFIRPQQEGWVLMVANADGTSVRQVTDEPLPSIDWYTWSPDGSRVAIAAGDGSVGTVSVGDGPDDGIFESLRLERPVSMPVWHPNGTSFLVRAVTPNGTGLFPVTYPGGSIGRPIRMSDTASPLFAGDRGASDLMEAIYSPDGSRIAYVQGQLATDGAYGVFGGPDTRNHVMNADGSNDEVIEFSPTSDYEDGAWFSPDGTRLSMVIREGDFHQIAVMTLDRSRPPVATEPEEDPNAMPAIWSPDGKQILAVRIADGVTYLIDPDTGEKVRQPWLADWADWQRIAP